MKRLFALIMTLFIIVSFSACGTNSFYDGFFGSNNESNTKATTENIVETPMTNAPATDASIDTPAESSITPLLYKVTDDKNNTVWLFGSIHVGMHYFYPLPHYVLDAYENADVLAVEFDMIAFSSDIAAQTQAALKMMYQDGTKISDHLSQETYEKAVKTLKELNTYYSVLDNYMPFMWYSTIENELATQAGYDSDLGIDMYFLNSAYETGKKISEVESAEFQYNMMANFSDEIQCQLLEEILYTYEDPELYFDDLDTLVELWSTGNEEEFSEYLNTETGFESEEDKALYEEYNKAMITDRNIGMTDFAEDALKSGEEVFICVGAAHVVGEGGMADQLAERGYKVEIVR